MVIKGTQSELMHMRIRLSQDTRETTAYPEYSKQTL